MCWHDDDLIPDDPLWDTTKEDEDADGDTPTPDDLLEDDPYEEE